MTQAQLQAVESGRRNIIVEAGAGSGKTRTMVHRIAMLHREGLPLSSVLVLTFTRKAALEMRDRLAQLVGEDSCRGMWLGTFHAVSYRILREWGERIGYQTTGGCSISVITPEESEAVWKEIQEAYRWRGTQATIEAARKALAHRGEEPTDPDLRRMLAEYARRLRENNATDYDGLLLEVHRLFRECPEALEHYRQRFVHVMVDEYQDTDVVQYNLHEILVGRPAAEAGIGGNLFAVGDARQAIYSWRGASVEIILGFAASHPQTETIALLDCFRCSPQITAAANALIANNPEGRRGLVSRVAPGAPVEARAGGADEIAAFLADDLAFEAHGGIAVIARTHRTLEYVEQACQALALPIHRVGGGASVEKSATWREFNAVLRCFSNPRDGIAWSVALPWFRFSDGQAAKLRKLAVEQGGTPMQALLASCRTVASDRFLALVNDQQTTVLAVLGEAADIARSWPEAEIEQAAARIVALGGESDTCAAWLERMAQRDMHTELESKTREGQITLITAHASKGLEWDIVLVVGMDEGEWPSARSIREKHLGEERRLAYVAMTRARRRLVLFTRKQPSRFITEAGLPCPQFTPKGVAA